MPRMLDRWTQGRVAIGLRWYITRTGEFKPGWPEPGAEHRVLSMGWVADDGVSGVIEIPVPPVDVGVLEILEQALPGRRWYAGEWDEQAFIRSLAA